MGIRMEAVTIADTEELLAIYRPYVEDTAITFEYEVPTPDEFSHRIETIAAKYPYLKAVDENGTILGYAYASVFKGRRAYDWSVESTIYLRPEAKRKGVGRALYTQLEKELKEMGILNVNACIAVTAKEDAHLTNDSRYFHEALGYSLVGTFHDSGFKFGTWYDMIWMEKMLGEHTGDPAPVCFGKK